MVENKEKFSFRPRARLIKILGEQLISSEVIALVELVKNSYDADATEVIIKLIDIQNAEKGKIIIEDNGTGITYEKIIGVWLEPATPEKKQSHRYSKCFERRLLGEKGIGRFAVHKLGGKVKLITRATTDCFKSLENYETVVNVDWGKFTENEYLDQVGVEVKTRKPELFLNNSGVYMEIDNINPWKESTLINTVRKLKALETPQIIRRITQNKGNTGKFRIKIESNLPELQNKIDSIRSIDELLDSSFYKMYGTIDEKGILNFTYRFRRPDYPELSRTISGSVDLREYIQNFVEELKKFYDVYSKMKSDKSMNFIDFLKEFSPGEFSVDFFVWDLDSSALKVAGLQKDYREVIRPNSGVRIYRDGFRVWPYGEEDDDWLGLDLKRLNAPKERLISRNQIVGFINISSEKNPKLIDQSNREGLIKNIQYEVFYELVKASIKHMSNLRKEDKKKMDELKEKKSYEDEVTQKISDLKKHLKRNNHYELYKKNVEEVEKAYKERVTDILDRYMQAAAIGISYTLPIHELNIRFESIESLLKEIERRPHLLNKYIRELERLLVETQDIVKVIGNLMKRRKRKDTSLLKVVKNVFKIKERELRKYDIEVLIEGDQKQKAYILESLIGTALLNLIDNAIYWIRVKRMQLREKGVYHKGTIRIILGEEDGKPYISIKDNGTGIKDPVEMLVEPYYSRKSDGYGLGLYIVDNIMKRHNGRLEAYNWKDGAVFKLIFENKKEMI